MSGSIVAFPARGACAQPITPTVSERLREFAAYLVQEWRVRRAASELHSLDARGLHDIGLTRGGIEGGIRHGLRGRGAADGVPEMIRATPEWPPLPSSWTEWR